ncbi:MAG TPA: hypothetical protein PK402_14685, partial [Tepidisphaeraceae bacterium]|nr:hypothetical protein [Tepidisphaeraceae bacterium]
TITASVRLGLSLPARANYDLDEPFISMSAGITLRPPAGGESALGAAGSDEIVKFFSADDNWLLVVRRLALAEPMQLAEREQMGDDARTRGGIVGQAASRMPNDTPRKMLRLNFIPIAGHDGVLLASQYHEPKESRYHQQAIIRRHDRLYYFITFTSPISDGADIQKDEAAKLATELFQSVLDSVELIDQDAIRQDQDRRLIRTRNLMINWRKDVIAKAIVPERYFRIQRNGKDVGYTYVIEELADSVPNAGKVPEVSDPTKALGVRIGMRSRTFPEIGRQVDTESWMWFTFDRKEEDFSNLMVTKTPDDKENFAKERGKSIQRDREVPSIVKNSLGQDEVVSRKQNQYELDVWS